MRATYAAARDRSARAPRPQVAIGASIPPPIEGWDAISPVQAMSPKRAIKLENWFPQLSWVELRRGCTRFATLDATDPVESVMSYQGSSDSAFFAASGSSIWDITPGGSIDTATVTGLTNARFQYINFAATAGDFLYLVNGADAPLYFDGTSWAVAVITGTGIDPTAFIHVQAHKGRIWFAINESSDAAYLAPDSVQGTAVKFPVGANWKLGGFLMAVMSWSIDGGNGPDDYLCFLSSRGEVSVYTGTDPASNFVLVGTYYIGPPLGRRCFTKVGADIAIISIDGVVPLSKALVFERAALPKVSMTANIQRVVNQSTRSYGNNYGWQLITYPRGTRAILNVPIVENETQEQYVMNTLSGAWCRFTGQNAVCWELRGDDLFFGGNNGVINQADQGSDDDNAVISYDMECAFNYFKMHGSLKRWMMCRPLLTTDQTVSPSIALNVDFQDNAPLTVASTPSTQAALWDQALWDNSVWASGIISQSNWITVPGIGYCASIRMALNIGPPNANAALWGIAQWGFSTWTVTSRADITLQVNGFDILFEKGAFI
jgi:hypothetical protein